MSPDPYDGSYDVTNPQSLNRYAYVLNNPLAFTDPSGQKKPSILLDLFGGGGFPIIDGNTSYFGSGWDEFQSIVTVSSPDGNGAYSYTESSWDTTASSDTGNTVIGNGIYSNADGGIGGTAITSTLWGLLSGNFTFLSSGQIHAPNPNITHYVSAYQAPTPPQLTNDPACYGAPDSVSAIHSLSQGIVNGSPQGSTDGQFGASIWQSTTQGYKPFGNAAADTGFNAGFMGLDYAVSVANCLQGH